MQQAGQPATAQQSETGGIVLPAVGVSTALDLEAIAQCEALIDAGRKAHPADLLNYGIATQGNGAVVGIDSYLFIGDGANKWEEQFLGRANLARGWLKAWARLFEARRQRAEREGVRLVNFVVPEKQVLLADKRWPGVSDDVGQTRPMRILLANLRQDARLFYPEQALRQAGGIAPTYARHDSHWSAFGCCIAIQALLREIGGAPRLEDQKLAVTRRHMSRDLSIHLFNNPVGEDVLRLEPNGTRIEYNEQPERTGRFTGTFYKLHNPKAPDRRRVAVFGDSYSFTEGATFVLSAVFETVTFLWSKDIDWGLVAEHKIDVVVWEHAERFMITTPET